MSVAARFETLSAAADAPRAPRRRLLIETGGETADGRTAEVTILNVSASGMLLETSVELAPSERIEVDLPRAGLVPAEVVWSDGPFHGCRFAAPLTEATLSALTLRSDPAGSPSDESEPFAERLRRLRKAQGLTLTAIAEALGVSKPTVWAWEQGRARPTADHMAGLAAMLGLEPARLSETGQAQRVQAALSQARSTVAEALAVDPAKVRFTVEL